MRVFVNRLASLAGKPSIAVLLALAGALTLLGCEEAELPGVQVRLRTAAYQPFDPTSGDFLRLSYEVEGRPSFELSGLEEGQVLWITVERAEPAWRKLSIDLEPSAYTEDRLSLRAEWHGLRAVLPGAARLHLDAADCSAVEGVLQLSPRAGIVGLQVERSGAATPRFIEVNGRRFAQTR